MVAMCIDWVHLIYNAMQPNDFLGISTHKRMLRKDPGKCNDLVV